MVSGCGWSCTRTEMDRLIPGIKAFLPVLWMQDGKPAFITGFVSCGSCALVPFVIVVIHTTIGLSRPRDFRNYVGEQAKVCFRFPEPSSVRMTGGHAILVVNFGRGVAHCTQLCANTKRPMLQLQDTDSLFTGFSQPTGKTTSCVYSFTS